MGVLGYAACAPSDEVATDDSAAAADGAAVAAPDGPRPEQLMGEVHRTRAAVMPFNVSGAESVLGYLESAVPEFLSRKLSYRAPPDAAFDATDLESARRQALAAGAGSVVMGAVVGNADRLTIRASLRLTKTGRVMAEESVTGRLDSLDALTSRLALQLALWGVDPGAREMIESTPQSVIDATLRGILALRQKDGVAAADEFQAALALDSTFAIAAEGLYEIATTVDISAELDNAEVTRLAQSLLHRSTAAFRAWWEADQGPDRTRIATVLEEIQRFEAAGADYPTSSWIWDRLAYLYFWNGAYAGIEDWYERALHAFRRKAEILGVDVPCEMYHHLLLRQLDPDPSVLSEYAEFCAVGGETKPFDRNFNRLFKVAILRDTAGLRRMRNSAAMDSIGAAIPWFMFYFVPAGYGLKEWRVGIEAAERNVSTEGERIYALSARFHLARIMGRPGDASAHFREWLASGRQTFWFRLSMPIVSALLEPGWEAVAAEAGSRTMTPDPTRGDRFDRLCYSEMARLAQGDTSQTRTSVAERRHAPVSPSSAT
jgi:tetratricopeptide (TPR) repeat protein